MNAFAAVVLVALASVLITIAIRHRDHDRALSEASSFFQHADCEDDTFTTRARREGDAFVFTITCSAEQR